MSDTVERLSTARVLSASLARFVRETGASLRGDDRAVSPVDDPTKPKQALGVTRAQRLYAIDKAVEEAVRGSTR